MFSFCADPSTLEGAAWLACGLMAVGSLVWFFPPMVARFLYGDAVMAQGINDPATTSYAFIARELLPNGLMGIMIAAMFAGRWLYIEQTPSQTQIIIDKDKVKTDTMAIRLMGYRGLAKNTAQLFTLFALSNLFMARRRLLQCSESPGWTP